MITNEQYEQREREYHAGIWKLLNEIWDLKNELRKLKGEEEDDEDIPKNIVPIRNYHAPAVRNSSGGR